METITIKVKSKKEVKNVVSLLSKMKSVEIIEPSYTNFEKGNFKKGEKPSDFVKHKKPLTNPDEIETLNKEISDLRRNAWKL